VEVNCDNCTQEIQGSPWTQLGMDIVSLNKDSHPGAPLTTSRFVDLAGLHFCSQECVTDYAYQ
jgi:hypothetical protein